MSSNISLTASMRSNLLSLQHTQKLFDSVQDRLATGKKVNSALDNPNNYFTAAALNNRANDLDGLMDSMGQGVQTLKAADQGIQTLTALVEQAKSLTTTALDASIISSKVQGTAKIEDFDDIREVAGINAGDKFVISTKEDGEKVESNMTRAVADATILSGLSDDLATDGKAYQFEIHTRGGLEGNKSTVIRLEGTVEEATVEDLVTAINNNTDVDVTASIDEDGKLVIESNDNSIVTIRNRDYGGELTGAELTTGEQADLSTLADVSGGTRFVFRAAEDLNKIESVDTGAASGDTFITVVGAGSARITFAVNGVSQTVVLDTGAHTYTDLASDINALAGISASFEDGILKISATDPSHNIVVTSFSGDVGDAIADLDLQADTFVSAVGTQSVGALVEAINTDGKFTASLTSEGEFRIEAKEVNQSIAAVATDAVASGVAVINDDSLAALFGTGVTAATATVANGTSELATTFGFDSYNMEITIPETATTADDLVTAINDAATAQSLDVVASIVDKKLVITDNLGNDLSVFDVNDSTSAQTLGVQKNDTSGANARAEYASQFDGLRTQMNELVQDTGYKGVNLLKGDDLTVYFNESRTSKLDITGVTFDAAGLEIQATENNWKTNADIEAQLTQVERALETLRSQASAFGNNLAVVQTREDFTQGMIDTLTAGADKLTLADMNEEAANMLALQTRQQLGTNSLSLASQSAQSVLKLF